MKKIRLLFTLALLCGSCSGRFYRVECSAPADRTQEVIRAIEFVTHTGSYNPGMRSGDTFFVFLSLGTPMEFGDIAFFTLSDKELFADPGNLDRWYRFAALTEPVFICDSTAKKGTLLLSDIICTYPELYELTSPLYNQSFRIAAPLPAAADSTSARDSVFYRSFYRNSIVTDNGRNVQVQIPLCRIAGNIMQLNVHRPWLSAPVVLKPEYKGKKIAVIDALIWAQNFSVEITDGQSIVRADSKRGFYRIADNPVTASSRSENILLGFICRIL